ncbi:hypothetical protein [Sansalvadorimonas verongulae]|uniref:hypothetical protein n=1 Tax=Sansalvadorimonas verongulae TaxID=2172824 RepID=UPI0012BC29B4|nr:hypothetical protein [Sansalvadorimonas verongulae]MTI15600.1 hypothetical protein [Sansalvadorimonas verongulae]
MGQSGGVSFVLASTKLDIDYRLVACQDRFRQESHRINIQQLVEDFNRLRTTATCKGIRARAEAVRFITSNIDLLSVVEDLDSEQEESRGLLTSLISDLYDLKPETAFAN